MELLIATKNSGKLHEYHALLAPYGMSLRSLFDYPQIGEIEENQPTFHENALIKAKALFEQTHLPTLSDDSGLQVEALNGEPGVHSKRFSSSGLDADNNALLLKKMESIPNRKATFVCVICYYEGPHSIHYFEGRTDGLILESPKGTEGFGYDPLFFVPTYHKTYAELTLNEKNQISHRKKAFSQLLAYFEDRRVIDRL